MDLASAMASRRSIRKFKPDPVDRKTLSKIFESVRLAPSSTNSQPWSFAVITDPDRREKLCQAAFGQKFIRQAPVVVVALGNRKAYNKRLRRGKELVDIGAVDLEIMDKVSEVYRDAADTDADAAIRFNCAIAIEHLILAATAEGLGSCWVMLLDKAALAEALELPKHLFPVAMIPLGIPDQSPEPRPRYQRAEIFFDGSINTPWTD